MERPPPLGLPVVEGQPPAFPCPRPPPAVDDDPAPLRDAEDEEEDPFGMTLIVTLEVYIRNMFIFNELEQRKKEETKNVPN